MQTTTLRATFRVAKTCAAFAAAAILLAGSGQAQTSGTPTPMQIGTFPIATNLPDQIAKNKGIFAKNGLDVTMVGPAMAGATAVALMAGGKLQFGG
jgi:ABC-type nitrate/sulfonate/bicarbonate transport system substrate-binding protein